MNGSRSSLPGVLDRLTTDLLALQRPVRRLRRITSVCDEGQPARLRLRPRWVPYLVPIEPRRALCRTTVQ